MSVEFRISHTDVVIDTIAVKRFVLGPDEDVGKEMWKRGIKVYAGAVLQVGVDTGRMRDRIRIDRGFDSYGSYVEIVSDDPITMMHHEGTRPHTIVPNQHKAMRFVKGGQAVFAHKVLHPGTRPNRFLTDNLRRAL